VKTPLIGDAEHKRPSRRAVNTLLAVLISAITVMGALVLAMLELNS
jgi:hypothetical protein